MGYLARVFRATEEENRRAILRALPPAAGTQLLDLGCHDGAFTVRVAERLRAGRTVGVEFVEEHASVARDRGIEVVAADLDDAVPLAGEQFDVVHANQVIEHVRRTDVFLREVRRLLRPGGLACLSTNNLSSWHNIFSLALGFQPMPMHVSDEVIVGNPLNPQHGQVHADRGQTHLRLFTGRALTELCAHHRLERVRLATAGYYPLPPAAGRVLGALDRRHGAFLVGLYRRHG